VALIVQQRRRKSVSSKAAPGLGRGVRLWRYRTAR
jgi:hypothetical protein